MNTIGEKIKKLRLQNNLTQKKLGNALDVSRHTIIKWENDSMQPNSQSIKLLCSYFGVNADYFFSDEGTRISTEIAVSSDYEKINYVDIMLIIMSCIIFICFVFMLLCAIYCGLATFSNNVGCERIASVSTDKSSFVIFLTTSIVLFALNLALIALIIKRRRNANKHIKS